MGAVDVGALTRNEKGATPCAAKTGAKGGAGAAGGLAKEKVVVKKGAWKDELWDQARETGPVAFHSYPLEE